MPGNYFLLVSSKFLFLVITACGMEEVSPDPAKSAGWPKPADVGGMVVGRSLMCRKTEVSVGNLVSPAGFKNCEYLLQIGRKFYLCRHHVPHGFAASLQWYPGPSVCDWDFNVKRDKNKSSLFLAGRLSWVVCFKVLKKKKEKRKRTSPLATSRTVIYTGWQTLHEVRGWEGRKLKTQWRGAQGWC